MQSPAANEQSQDRPLRVGIFGHYGRLNLGDESLTTAVIANLRRLAPGVQIVGFSLDPKDTQARHNIPAYTIRSYVAPLRTNKPQAPPKPPHAMAVEWRHRIIAAVKRIPGIVALRRLATNVPRMFVRVAREARFLFSIWDAVGAVDLLLVTGSNQMLDFMGGAWEFPYTLLKWTTVATLRGVKVAFVSVGAGPLDTPNGRRFVRWSLNRAAFVSVRDEGSRVLVREIGYRGTVRVAPDLAFSTPAREQKVVAHTASGKTIAMNPMPLFDLRYWPQADVVLYRRYVDGLTGLARSAVAEGNRVVLFSMQPGDEWVADDILEQIGSDVIATGRITLAKTRSLDAVQDILARSDLSVASRFHGILHSMHVGTPVLGICYYRKSRELMKSAGMDEFAVDADRIDVEDLVSRLRRLDSRSAAVRDKLAKVSRANQALLEQQYRDLLRIGTSHVRETAESRIGGDPPDSNPVDRFADDS